MKPFWIIIACVALIVIVFLAYNNAQTINTDRLAQLSYYGIWGLAASSALLGSGIKLGDALRNIAIWLVIIFALMAAYSLRYELQDFASRVSAGIIPGSPVTRYSENGKAVSLERSANGHFQSRAFVNDTPITMTVDTGASTVVLSYADAIAAKINVGNLSFTFRVNTANGDTYAAPIMINSLKIGDIERDNVHALVSRAGDLSGSLLGMSFLDRLSGYSVRGDRLILVD